jgi:L-threonylcarbamoyladenylate synthase
MKTRVVQVHSAEPEPEAIAQAAAVIRAGGLVAFPTETVYGLGANALEARAVARIFEAKGRPSTNPLIVHVPDCAAAQSLASTWPESAEQLAERFWPGPLTLILPKRDLIPDNVTGGGATVALRVPAHPVAQALLRSAQVPLAAPSANRSEQISPTQAAHVLRGLDGRIELLLEGGPTSGGLESTVLLLTSPIPRILRPGLVSPAEIEAVIGPVERPAVAPEITDGPSLSPGQMARHYAPRLPMELTSHGAERVQTLLAQGERVGWLTFAPDALSPAACDSLRLIIMPDEPEAYAARLYAAMHELDALPLTRLVADAPPASEAWLAVRDRLLRASDRSI